MLTGIIIIAVVALLGVLSHRRSKLVNKMYRDIPLSEWLSSVVIPVLLYLGWFITLKNIIERPRIEIIPMADFDLLAIATLFMIYGFSGNSLHFVSKALWTYLKSDTKSKAYRVNEMFHNKLSHYLVYLNSLFTFFMLVLIEINHPVVGGVFPIYTLEFVLMGIVFGISATKAFFYTQQWFGGYTKTLFIVSLVILTILVIIGRVFAIQLKYYPIFTFILTMFITMFVTFFVRQAFIFSKLSHRKRLSFLSKILSV